MVEIGENVTIAVNLLQAGDLVAIPTETVYGLAGNALNPTAVAKIFTVKNRPSFNPLITHTNSLEKMLPFVEYLPDMAYRVAEHFWPGPLTILLPKTSSIPDIVTAGLSQVAVRIPQHPLTQQLLAALEFPVAAPSANPFGYVSPTQAVHVAEQLGEKISYVLDGGSCKIGIESTIVGFEEEKTIVYRWGGVSKEELQEVTGQVVVPAAPSPERVNNPVAPGMLKSHYSPQREVVVGNISELLTQYPLEKVAILSFCDEYPQLSASHQVILSASGSLNEAAQKLFAALRYLDKLPVAYILTELVPDSGLGRAINDRLMRAAARA